MDKKLPKGRVAGTFLVNVVFAILFPGCYSSMHQGQVTDGYSMTFAYRPLHRVFVYGGPVEDQAADIRASMALRYGHAPSEEGERGYSIGLVVDSSAPVRVDVEPYSHTEGDRDISSSSGSFVRGNYYYQFPKNSFLDAGIGGEFGILPPGSPVIPYVVMSKDLGSRFTLYGEIRVLHGVKSDNEYLAIPTLGAIFDVLKGFSLFAEASLFPELISCRYHPDYMRCEYRSSLDNAPVMGVGIVIHHRSEKEPGKLMEYLEKGLGCLGCLSLFIYMAALSS